MVPNSYKTWLEEYKNPNPRPLADWSIYYRFAKEFHWSIDQIEAMDSDMFMWFLALLEAEDKKQEKENEKLKAK